MTAPDPGHQERREVAEGAGLASVGLLINGVLGLALLAVLTRAMPKEEFALFQLIYMVQETVAALLPLGLPAALSYFVPRVREAAARAFGFWTGMALLLMALPVAVLLPLLVPLASPDPQFRVAAVYLAGYLLLDLPGQALSGYLLACRRYRSFFRVTVGFTVTRVASLAVPASLGAPIETVFAVFVLGAGLRFAWFLDVFLRRERGSLAPGLVRPGELLAYGVPLSLAQMVGKANIQADKYLVAAAASRADFASYSVGAIELPLVTSLAYSVTNALVPALSAAANDGDVSGFLRYWHGSVLKVAAVVMPVFCYFFVLAEPAMRVLFTAQFAAAAVPFRAYLLLLPFRLCSYGAVLRALGRTRSVLYASVVALAANLILIYPLYRMLGLVGPALAAVAGQAVMIGIQLAGVRSGLGLTWARVMPFRGIGLTLLLAAVSVLPAVGLRLAVPGDGFQLLAGAGLTLSIYLLLGYRGGIISDGDLRYLGRLLTFRGGRGAARR